MLAKAAMEKTTLERLENELLRHFNISVAVTTYQAGRLIFLRPEGALLRTSLARPALSRAR
jgi:hypothetical protein